MELFGNGCATHDVAAFENPNFLAGLSQITGADQTVVASADDNVVVFVQVQLTKYLIQGKA